MCALKYLHNIALADDAKKLCACAVHNLSARAQLLGTRAHFAQARCNQSDEMSLLCALTTTAAL